MNGSSTALRALPWSLCGGAVLSLAVIALQVSIQSSSPTLLVPRSVLFAWIGAGALTAGVAGLLLRGVPLERWRWLAGPRGPGILSFLVALNVSALLLTIPVALFVWRADADLAGGWTYPFLNKRWVVALYYLFIAASLVFPILAARTFDVRRAEAASDEGNSWRASAGWPRTAGALAVVIAVSWLFAGPPWHMDRHHRPIDFHEQVHLGPLQAIDKGYLPFVGPASTQYGPGSQLLTYWLMRAQGRFDVVAFRTAQAALHFTAAVAVGLLAYRLCGFWRALAILLLAFSYSPLRFLFPLADGTMGGDYGWGNAWRYLGPLVVVPASAVIASDTSRPHAKPLGMAMILGFAWGAFSWIAQENLLSTFTGGALTLALLVMTDTASWRRAGLVASGLLAGCALVWLLVLVYYGWHGAAGRYLFNYFVIGSAVAMGFQNTWWADGDSLRLGFYFTAPLTITIAVCTLWDLRQVRPRRPLGSSQVRLLALTAVLLACYHTALYRSDGAHLMNTMIALPFVVVLALSDLPDWTVRPTAKRRGLRLAIAGCAFWLFPFGAVLAHPAGTLFVPVARFHRQPDVSHATGDSGIAFRRATANLSDEPAVSTGGPTMRAFLEFAELLRDDIGARPVYVADTFFVYSSLYYFIADLTPAPHLGDKETMVINNVRHRDSLEHMRRHIAQFGSVVTTTLDSDEAKVFLEAYPGARVVRRSLWGRDLFVLLTGPGQAS